MIYCGKGEFGQISRSFSLNSGAIRLKRSKNLTQIGFPSLRSVKSDRLLGFGMDRPAADDGGRHPDVLEGVNGDLKRVVGQHDQVGQLAWAAKVV